MKCKELWLMGIAKWKSFSRYRKLSCLKNLSEEGALEMAAKVGMCEEETSKIEKAEDEEHG